MIVPIVIGGSALAFGLAYVFRKKAPPLTPDQQMVHDVAMTSVNDPKKLIKLAQVFHAQGYPAHASSLMQRAGLLRSPKIISVGGNRNPSPSSSASASGSAGVSVSTSGNVSFAPDVAQGGVKRDDEIYFNFTPGCDCDE